MKDAQYEKFKERDDPDSSWIYNWFNKAQSFKRLKADNSVNFGENGKKWIYNWFNKDVI